MVSLHGGGRLAAGVGILAFFVAQNMLVTYMTTQQVQGVGFAGCTEADNITTCESIGKTDFFADMLKTGTSGIEGMSDELNLVYVTGGAIALALGALLVVLAFLPFTS